MWSTAFILYTSTVGFFGPLLIICLCYLLIIVKVRAGRETGGHIIHHQHQCYELKDEALRTQIRRVGAASRLSTRSNE